MVPKPAEAAPKNSDTKRAYRTYIVLGVVVGALLIAYFGAYCALVTRAEKVEVTGMGIKTYTYYPTYTHGGKLAESAFALAHRVDVGLRPEIWQQSEVKPPMGENTRIDFSKYYKDDDKREN